MLGSWNGLPFRVSGVSATGNGELDRIRQMTHPEPVQIARAMELDPPHADAQLMGDHLVRLASDQGLENLAPAR